MIIRNCAFDYSMAGKKDYRHAELPEIAIVGKSNVGKSSLINTVMNMKKLARTSSQPGKTRLVNFFLVNETFYLVDLPGYGFAKASKTEQARWSGMIEEYFSSSPQLRHMLLLVDIRHAPTALDVVMLQWIRHYQIPYTIIATKCDKIAKSKRKQYFQVIAKKLELSKEEQPIYFSAPEKLGREEILELFDKILI